MAMTASRKSMHSVMAHPGFGECTISRPDGIIAIIPQNQITKATGAPKKKVAARLNELTRENIVALERMGVQLYFGGCHA